MPFETVNKYRNPLNLWSGLSPSAIPFRTLASRLQRDRGWVFFGGLVYAALGYFALVRPFAAALGLNWVLGALLVVTGVIQLVNLVRWRGHDAASLLQAVISLLAGVIMLRLPAIGLMGVTLIITFYLFSHAVARWMAADALRPTRGWGMLLFNSIISFSLGVILLFEFPISALWAPGVFLGVDLLVTGIAMMSLAFALRIASAEETRHVPIDKSGGESRDRAA